MPADPGLFSPVEGTRVVDGGGPYVVSVQRPSARHRVDAHIRVALLIPLQGPAGIFGPSCELCTELAVQQINDEGGLLGCEVQLLVVDGGDAPARVADQVDRLLREQQIDAIVGWHSSAVRQAVAPRVLGRVPYVYTALYEGGEVTPGLFMTGETPQRQVLAALRWMVREVGLARWIVVGDDYVWPRRTAAAAAAAADEIGVRFEEQVFVTPDSGNHAAALSSASARRLPAPPAPVPGGDVNVREQHLEQRIYLARASGLDFDILTAL